MKQLRITSILIVSAVLMLLPLDASADQCIDGDCVNGRGTMVYSTGHRYTGEFKNGMRDGEGLMTMPGGRTLQKAFSARPDSTRSTARTAAPAARSAASREYGFIAVSGSRWTMPASGAAARMAAIYSGA